MNTQKLYTNYLDGIITKEKFLYEVRRDSRIPYITNHNSFNDTIIILKNKRLISEDTYKAEKGISTENNFLTLDTVNPYEYARGIDYELGLCTISVGLNTPDKTDLFAAQKKVLKNLTSDPFYYTKKKQSAEEKKQEKENQRLEPVTPKYIASIPNGKKNIIREGFGNPILDKYNKLNGRDLYTWLTDLDNTELEGLYKDVTGDFVDGLERDSIINKLSSEDTIDESSNIRSKILYEMALTEEDLDDEDIRSEVEAEVERQSPRFGMEEAAAQNDPKIERLVAQLNDIIAKAVDEDGDPIGVIDTSSTWEEPYIYSPIEYKNGALKITSVSEYGGEPKTEVILKRNMDYDGIGTLRDIAKHYRRTLKQRGIQEDVMSPEEKKANDLSLAAEKAKVVASNKKIQDLQR